MPRACGRFIVAAIAAACLAANACGEGAAGPPQGAAEEAQASAGASVDNASDPLRGHFAKFVSDFGKRYSPGEVESRFAAFKESFQAIESCNAQNHTFRCGLNEHADIFHSDFIKTHLGGRGPPLEGDGAGEAGGPPDPDDEAAAGSGASAPASVNWVPKGVVTPVLNQGSCGSCWAFVTTAAISSAWAIKTGKLILLSQQHLLDCFGKSCKTGQWVFKAMGYAAKYGLCTAASYPYRASTTGSCAARCVHGLSRHSIRGYRMVAKNNELALTQAVAGQPVSVNVRSSDPVFKHYSSGIISRACGTQTDHVVLLVGYSSGYWLGKNSWGTSWGEKGYVRIARGPGPTGTGECGILWRPSYPLVGRAESANASSAATQAGPRRLGGVVEQPTLFA